MELDENGYSAEWRTALALERIAAVLEGIVSSRAAKTAENKARDRELMDLLQLRLEGKI